MTATVDPELTEGIVGFKLEGELNDYQIVPDRRVGNSTNELKVSGPDGTLAEIPRGIVKPSSGPICGNIAVSESENVIIGNNTYFNGPVTIKQVFQNITGVDNSAYVKNDNETRTDQQCQDDLNVDKSTRTTAAHLQKWHKLVISAVCVVLLSILLAILSVVLRKDSQLESTTLGSGDVSAHTEPTSTEVVGMCYNFSIGITVLIGPLIVLILCLLTSFGTGVNKKTGYAIMKKQNNNVIDLDDYPRKKTIKKDDPLIIAPEHLRIVSRTDWLAQPVENELDKIRQPVPWVVISHTATESCNTQSECVLRVRLIQTFHIESRGWSDIAYNFLVAGDGSAYIGRGWDYVGAHTLYYNKFSIGISFIGTFNNDPPPQRQLDACLKLLKKGVDSGKLAKDYKLFAHRQLSSTLSPGDKLYDIIKEWPHFAKNYTYGDTIVPTY